MRHVFFFSFLFVLIGCASDQTTEDLPTASSYTGTWEYSEPDMPDITLHVEADGRALIGNTEEGLDEGRAELEEDGSLTVTAQTTGPPARWNVIYSFIPSENDQIQLVRITLYDLAWIMWGDPVEPENMYFSRVTQFDRAARISNAR